MQGLRIIFAFIYLFVDISYVLASQKTYAAVTKRIQGFDFPKGRLLGAVVAYAALTLGWFAFAAPTALQMVSKGTHPAVAGALAGMLYGFVVYGVFNGTLYVMLQEWNVAISMRDMLWGITWASLATCMYAIVATKMK